MSETINFTRLTSSDKLPDRFLTCQFYQPVDPDQIDSGVIFSQIEILTPWFPSSQIGQTAINTLIREYYRGTDTSDLVNFENAIKGVNRVLSQFAQNGETDWIGKLSGVLILINKKEIHIAQTGHSHAYLYRGSKINHITEGLDIDDEPHPLKTFTNLTSGTLQMGDKIVVANSSFFENIAPSELKLLVSNYRPTLAALECAKILKSHGNRVANAIFLESTSKEELANIPPEQKIESVYLDQSGINFSLVAKNFFKNSVGPAFKALGRATVSGARATGRFIAPRVKKSWEKTREGSIKSFETAQSVVSQAKRREKEEAPHTYSVESKDEAGRVVPKKSLLKAKNKLRRMLITLGLYSRDKSKMVLGVFVLVVIILAAALTYSFAKNRWHSNAKNLEQRYAQLTSLDGEASIAASKRDDQTALQKYKEIYNIALELQDTDYADKTKEFLEKANAKITEITKLRSISSLKTLDLEGDTLAIGVDSKRIIGVLSGGEIKERKATDAGFVTLLSATLPSNKIVSLTELEVNLFALVFDNKALAILDPVKKTITTQEIKLKSDGQIKSFGENIYLLDTTNNQIWKITAEDSKYTTSSTYLKDQSIKISDAVDLAIDGSIYTLNGSGQIMELSRGTKINEFKVTLPGSETLTSYKKIFTSENSTSIFIVAQDGNRTRIIEIKKNGNFLAQYYLESADSFQEIVLDSYLREIYVLKDKKILEYRI
ncbi:MAG: hypothetical protein OEV37_03895 [Candidatus Berkelbacteria bacterium]|nr:hypothetical protein [Candidatus Berkelbacteria bacterium]